MQALIDRKLLPAMGPAAVPPEASHHPRWAHRRRLCLLWALLACWFCSDASLSQSLAQETTQDAASPTTWTNLEGKAIEAEFVRMTDSGVVLRLKADGREAEVPFKSLSIESHFQAMKLAHPDAFNKPLMKAPIPVEVPEPPFTFDPDELLLFPFADNVTIDQYLSTIKSELEADNAFVLWHCLPPKMQQDIALLVEKGYGKLGPNLLTQLRTLLNNFESIARNERDMMLQHSVISSNPPLASRLEGIWPQMTGLIVAIADDSLWQPDNFKKENVPKWLATFFANALPYASQLEEPTLKVLPSESLIARVIAVMSQPSEYKILSQSADSAEVEITLPGQPPFKLYLQKVDKIWVPGKEFNQLRQHLNEALAAVEKADASLATQAQVRLIEFNGIMGALAIADSQEKFNEAIDNLVIMLQGLSPANIGASGQAAGGARGRGTRRSGPGS